MMLKLIGTGMVALALTLGAGTAQAQDRTVCGMLDANPTVHGVEDVIGVLIAFNGLTPEGAAEFMFNEVNGVCPRHLITLSMFLKAYGFAPGEARYKI